MCRANAIFVLSILILTKVNYDLSVTKAVSPATSCKSEVEVVPSQKRVPQAFSPSTCCYSSGSFCTSQSGLGFPCCNSERNDDTESFAVEVSHMFENTQRSDATMRLVWSRTYHDPQEATPWSHQPSQQGQAEWGYTQGQAQGHGHGRSPRRRSKRQNRGKGQHQTYAAPVQQAPIPAPVPPASKGDGKGQTIGKGQFANNVLVPPPPPPLIAAAPLMIAPSTSFQQASPQESVWASQTGSHDGTAFAPVAAPPSDAEVRLKSLLKELKRAPEESLTPALQEEVKKNTAREEEIAAKGLHKAVDKVKKARKAVSTANAARVKLMTDWRVFLQQSVVTWQEYTTMFQTQERALQETLNTAIESLATAKRNFCEQSESMKEADAQEISDEERDQNEPDINMQSENSKRLHEVLASVVTSLQDLSEKAEQEEQKAKRQRKATEPTEEDGGDQLSSALPSMQPFGVPGSK